MNVPDHSAIGKRSLAIHVTREGRVSTATFIPQEARHMPGYGLIASPTLYPGQTITAGISSDANVRVNLFVRLYGAGDELVTVTGQPVDLRAGESQTLSWLPEDIDGGSPIAEVGLHVVADQASSASEATVYLDYLTWSGAPTVVLTKPRHNGTMWQPAWVKACDDLNFNWGGAIRICQDDGTGLLIQGEREWSNYTVRATLTPHLARGGGIAACVQGLRRYYALLLCDDQKVRLVKALAENPCLDPERCTLAEVDHGWQLDVAYSLSLTTQGDRLIASVNGRQLFDVQDAERPLMSGAVALVIEEGRLDCDAVTVTTFS